MIWDTPSAGRSAKYIALKALKITFYVICIIVVVPMLLIGALLLSSYSHPGFIQEGAPTWNTYAVILVVLAVSYITALFRWRGKDSTSSGKVEQAAYVIIMAGTVLAGLLAVGVVVVVYIVLSTEFCNPRC